MIPELGFFLLITAFVINFILVFLPILQNRLAISTIVLLANTLEKWQCVSILLAFIVLEYCFYANDFTVLYVYEHSNTLLPWYYKLTALWGGHEGSLLLWIALLSIWILLTANKIKTLPTAHRLWMSATLGLISCGFLGFILFTSNPFERLLPFSPENGVDLNPMLQDPGLIIHPPILYFGYVGFAIGFAFAIAVLITGQYINAWIRYLKPLVSLSWCFLTAGITLGSWWAYYELGWGGWWFWDPVENASLMPWLIGAALLHILPAVEKQDLFKRWSVILLLVGFILSLLGTFLVRSGVLTSVHAFASDPKRGVYILIYLSCMTLLAIGLYFFRYSSSAVRKNFSFVSRESLLFLNNLLLVAICFTVIIGTLYPIIIDWLNLGFISVGPPYFNSVIMPIGVLLLLLMLAAPMSRWVKIQWEDYQYLILESFCLLAIIICLYFNFYWPLSSWLFVFSLFLSLLLIIEHIRTFIHGYLKNKKIIKFGMLLAHLGFVFSIIGIIVVSNFSIENDLNMGLGDSVTAAGYRIKFNNLSKLQGPNYSGVQGGFVVSSLHDNKPIARLFPERRLYTVSKTPMSKTAIDAGLFRDIYIALSNPINDTQWAVRVYYKPFVRWLWVGGIMMFFGGLFAVIEQYWRDSALKVKQGYQIA